MKQRRGFWRAGLVQASCPWLRGSHGQEMDRKTDALFEHQKVFQYSIRHGEKKEGDSYISMSSCDKLWLFSRALEERIKRGDTRWDIRKCINREINLWTRILGDMSMFLCNL